MLCPASAYQARKVNPALHEGVLGDSNSFAPRVSTYYSDMTECIANLPGLRSRGSETTASGTVAGSLQIETPIETPGATELAHRYTLDKPRWPVSPPTDHQLRFGVLDGGPQRDREVLYKISYERTSFRSLGRELDPHIIHRQLCLAASHNPGTPSGVRRLMSPEVSVHLAGQ